jgi:hypothetical protein
MTGLLDIWVDPPPTRKNKLVTKLSIRSFMLIFVYA